VHATQDCAHKRKNVVSKSVKEDTEVVEGDIYYSTIFNANEEKNAEMGCFKRPKFWKKAGNCKTGVVFSRLGLLCII